MRKLVLTVHLVFSVGWIGAALGYLALGVAAAISDDGATVRAAWIAMALMGWSAVVPLAIGALVSGIVVSLLSPWGLFRHYWVVISLLLTAFAVAVTVTHMPTVSSTAEVARGANAGELGQLGGDLVHPGVGLVVLLVIVVLNVYKPRGRTGSARRRRDAERPTSVGTDPSATS